MSSLRDPKRFMRNKIGEDMSGLRSLVLPQIVFVIETLILTHYISAKHKLEFIQVIFTPSVYVKICQRYTR